MTSNQSQTNEEEMFQDAMNSADNLGAEDFNIVNPLELIYRFIYNPNSEYKEISKQWSLTYLSEDDKRELLRLAKNIRIYDQPKYYVTVRKKKLIGYKQVEREIDGEIVQEIVPKYEIQLKYESRFHELIEKDIGRIHAITAAAGGLKGALIRAFRTTNLNKEESVEDKTAPRSGWLPKRN